MGPTYYEDPDATGNGGFGVAANNEPRCWPTSTSLDDLVKEAPHFEPYTWPEDRPALLAMKARQVAHVWSRPAGPRRAMVPRMGHKGTG